MSSYADDPTYRVPPFLIPRGTIGPWPPNWGTPGSLTCDLGACDNLASLALYASEHGWLPGCRYCALREERERVRHVIATRYRSRVFSIELAQAATSKRLYRAQLLSQHGPLVHALVSKNVLLSVRLS